ncbi:MAG: ATP-binding cassette domain-containing protein [Deltaproteobacteria bacterium]|nr:ATP-binding cassette domain-containing protein [Deltaproteobacteria bacterium]
MNRHESIIVLERVSKAFNGTRVLSDFSLAIDPGETMTILGGSGTGKSVTLKLILGLLRPDQGRILFRGTDVGTMDEQTLNGMRKQIGMLFQGGALFDSLSVRENIAYPLREHFRHHDEMEIGKIVAHSLSLVGLPGVEQMMPVDLSGGMRKRVALARAIATRPAVILYDEPTTGLDPANTQRINRLIRELQTKLEVTSIVVTHDMESAFQVTDRMALLYNRRVEFVGTVEEVRSSSIPVVQNFIHGHLDAGNEMTVGV